MGEEVETPTREWAHAQTNTTLRYQRDTFCKNTPESAGTRGFRDEREALHRPGNKEQRGIDDNKHIRKWNFWNQ